MEKADKSRYITMADIIDYLNNNNIKAERKSIYADIETLKNTD